ncbi:MAG: hypothetical protein U0R50_05565 [Gaiellales bacterium]
MTLRRRSHLFAHAVLASFTLVAVTLVASASAGKQKPVPGPRIVAGAMLDRDRDGHADGVRLSYSRVIRHARDVDGRYPFTVVGYRVTAVATASGKALVLSVAELAGADTNATPVVRYGKTKRQPVVDLRGRQAVKQAFMRIKAHGVAPPPVQPPPPPTEKDVDGDGYLTPADCKPDDAAIHPGAADRPDLGFIDTNCDGIDGDVKQSLFVAMSGSDTNPGTQEKPLRQVQAALGKLGGNRSVLVATGVYARVVLDGLPAGIGIYGGYDARSWARSEGGPLTVIAGSPEGVVVQGTFEVTIQLASVQGVAANEPGATAYGIRVVGPAPADLTKRTLTLQKAVVTSGPGVKGLDGLPGVVGRNGGRGGAAGSGACDSGPPGAGGLGAQSPWSVGGNGGRGGAVGSNDGLPGTTPGSAHPGVGGKANGGNGTHGTNGLDGKDGLAGFGGATQFLPTPVWDGAVGKGGDGRPGAAGEGGSGGGGGAGQGGAFVVDGAGNGGGGGASGGEGGAGGQGAMPGGASFGLWVIHASVVLESVTVTSGDGAVGGRGGDGGRGGLGGIGGLGGQACPSEIGRGGNGGQGSNGGRGGGGGGGAGGPSVAVAILESKLERTDTTLRHGAGGAGGSGGLPNVPSVPAVSGEALDLVQ